MSGFAAKLAAFLMSNAPPEGYRLADLLYGGRPDYPPSSNLHFILKLHGKASDVLAGGDPLLRRFRFGRAEVDGLWKAYAGGVALVHSGVLEEEAEISLRALPALMKAVGTYYEDKMEADEGALKDVDRRLAELEARHDAFLYTENFEGLLDFYPHEASYIYDDGKTIVPERSAKVYPLVRRAMAKALREEFFGPIPLGPSELIREQADAHCFLMLDKMRNAGVLSAIQTVADGLNQILSPARPLARVIAFRAPRQGAKPV